jgi:hypothetical protein
MLPTTSLFQAANLERLRRDAGGALVDKQRRWWLPERVRSRFYVQTSAKHVEEASNRSDAPGVWPNIWMQIVQQSQKRGTPKPKSQPRKSAYDVWKDKSR